MRMRKKKNLEERLAQCADNLIIIDREDRNFNSADNDRGLFDLSELFGNTNPTELEIGCGKGQFACTLAQRQPQVNLLAAEKCANVIVSACEKARKAEIGNVKFLKCSAEYLESYIPPHSISRIYLNFSCPFPKNKYASHRLTAAPFLKIYKNIMAPDAEIHMKTDNAKLFEFSIEQLSNAGFALKNVTLDLHNSGFENNIVTEYEQKFVDQGLPIYRLEAYVKAN